MIKISFFLVSFFIIFPATASWIEDCELTGEIELVRKIDKPSNSTYFITMRIVDTKKGEFSYSDCTKYKNYSHNFELNFAQIGIPSAGDRLLIRKFGADVENETKRVSEIKLLELQKK